MPDFNAIFQPETEADRQQSNTVDANKQASLHLYHSLRSSDFLAAGKILQQAGSCQWDTILKSDLGSRAMNEDRFPAHLTMGKDQTSIEIFEKFPGTYRTPPTFVPRLTVTDDNCDKKLKK